MEDLGPGHRDPARADALAASGSHQTPVATFFAKYYGTGDGARTDTPCHTITVKDRMANMQAALQAPPFTEAHEARAREVAAFLRAHGAWDGGDLVTGLSAHGIRKHRASVFKENGAAPEQRMAFLGHETQSEAARYSKSADLQKIVSGKESSNLGDLPNVFKAGWRKWRTGEDQPNHATPRA